MKYLNKHKRHLHTTLDSSLRNNLGFESGEPKPLVHFAPTSSNATRTPVNRHRLPTSSSSSSRKATSSNNTVTSRTPGSTSASDDTNTVLAITAGRGDARTEVGMAAIDLQYPYMIICQISDSQTYIDTLTKIYIFNPVEIIMPDTMCDEKNKLYCSIRERFRGLSVNPISRFHFNEKAGLERVQKHCCTAYSSVIVFVKQKYYALAATAALLKYVEYIQHIVYGSKSMKIEFQGSPHCAVIDIESAEKLELVVSQGNDPKICLLGALDRCLTPMGRRLLRVSILQPPCRKEAILERQRCVSELVTNHSLRTVIQPVVRRLYGADRLLNMGVLHLHTSTVQNAERNLNYVLLLKNCLDVVPELRAALTSSESSFFEKVRKNLENNEFETMKEKILKVVHQNARSVMGYTSASMQRCFAIKTGINDLLDVARRTYCELIEDMKTMVEELGKKYNLPMSLACNATLGYHIQVDGLRCRQFKETDFPSDFIQVQRRNRGFTMTTIGLLAMSNQCKMSYDEIHIMSDIVLMNLLADIKEHVGFLFQLSSDVAELDLIVSLAQVSHISGFVKPTFGSKLELQDCVHPIMKLFGTTPNAIANDVRASTPYNFHLITGPNMSGKSVYIKQVVLTQIMAQIGCYVLATKAEFRIANRILCRICFHDDIECQASTFTLEMKEAQYILQSVTPHSLVVLDEPCRATAVEEGSSIAFGLCEKLLSTSAFIFCASHFTCLSKLADMYFNVTNHCFRVITEEIEGSDTPRILYTHKLIIGEAPNDNYGITLATMSGLPKVISTKAYRVTETLASKRNSNDKHTDQKMKDHISSLKKRYDLVAFFYEKMPDRFDRETTLDLIKALSINVDKERRESYNFKKRTVDDFTQSKPNTVQDVKFSMKNVFKNSASGDIAKNKEVEIKPSDKTSKEGAISENRSNDYKSETRISNEISKLHTTASIEARLSQEFGIKKVKRAMDRRELKLLQDKRGRNDAQNAPETTTSEADSSPRKTSRYEHGRKEDDKVVIKPKFMPPVTDDVCTAANSSPLIKNVKSNQLRTSRDAQVIRMKELPVDRSNLDTTPFSALNLREAQGSELKRSASNLLDDRKRTARNATGFASDNNGLNSTCSDSRRDTSESSKDDFIMETKGYCNEQGNKELHSDRKYCGNNDGVDKKIELMPRFGDTSEKPNVNKRRKSSITESRESSNITNSTYRANKSSISSTEVSPSPTTETIVSPSDLSSHSLRINLRSLRSRLGVKNIPRVIKQFPATKSYSPKSNSPKFNGHSSQKSSLSFVENMTFSILDDSKNTLTPTLQSLIRVNNFKNVSGIENKQQSNDANITDTSPRKYRNEFKCKLQSVTQSEHENFQNAFTQAIGKNVEKSIFKLTPTNVNEHVLRKNNDQDARLLVNSPSRAQTLSYAILDDEPENFPVIRDISRSSKTSHGERSISQTGLGSKFKDVKPKYSERTFRTIFMNEFENSLDNHQIDLFEKSLSKCLQEASQRENKTKLRGTCENYSQNKDQELCAPEMHSGTGRFTLSKYRQGQLLRKTDIDSPRQKLRSSLSKDGCFPLEKAMEQYPHSLSSSNESYVVPVGFFEPSISKMTTVSDFTFVFENNGLSQQSESSAIAKYTARAKEAEIFRLIEGDAFDEDQFFISQDRSSDIYVDEG